MEVQRTEIQWETLYREWENYAEHFGLDAGDVCVDSLSEGTAGLMTMRLLAKYQGNPEVRTAIWLASFCRDVMQDYSYLLNSRAYQLVNQIYFLAFDLFKEDGLAWSSHLSRLQPKLFISYRILEGLDLTNYQSIVELAMLQASLTNQFYNRSLLSRV